MAVAKVSSPDPQILGVLPAAALDERVAIVGTSGSGKTYAAKGWIEQLLDAGARVCVVDPLGVWWGLMLGKKPTGGHWNSGVATLRNNGLIEVSGRSMRAAELFR